MKQRNFLLYVLILLIIGLDQVKSSGETCSDKCLDCQNGSECMVCSKDTILHEGSCVTECPHFYYPIQTEEKDTFLCRKIENPSILNESLIFFKDYELKNYVSENYDVFPLFQLEAQISYHISFWMYIDPSIDVTKNYSVVTFSKYHGSHNTTIYGRIFELTIEKGYFYVSTARSQSEAIVKVKPGYWNRVDYDYEIKQGIICSLEEPTTQQYRALVKGLNTNSGLYMLYSGGRYGFSNFPGKITNLRLFTFSLLVNSPDTLKIQSYMDGIKAIEEIYTFDQVSNINEVYDKKKSNKLVLHEDNKIRSGRLSFEGKAKVDIPIIFEKKAYTIRFYRDIFVPIDEQFHTCGLFGLYLENGDPVLVSTGEFSRYLSLTTSASYLIVNHFEDKKYHFEHGSSEEVISVLLFENQLIIANRLLYIKYDVGQTEKIHLVLGAQGSQGISNSCNFTIENLVIAYGGFSNYYSEFPTEGCVTRDTESNLCLHYFGKSLNYEDFKPKHLCPDNCSLCEGDFCTACVVGSKNWLLEHGKCVEKCSPGYEEIFGGCRVIPPFCENYSCMNCKNGYDFDKDGNCVKACTTGFYAKTTELENEFECKPCSTTSCASCEDDICTICESGLFLYQGQCLQTCPNEAPYTDEQNCRECMIECNKCNKEKQCIECAQSYYLFDNKTCLANCPPTWGVFGKICIATIKNCIRYSSEDWCGFCDYDYYLFNGTCHEKCPDNTTSYYAPHYVDKLECGSSCPNGTYQVGNKCVDCSANCLTCQGPNECEVCINGLFRDEGKCVEVCPPFTFPDHHVCKPCGKSLINCKVCESENICLQCEPGYYLHQGVCRKECDDSLVYLSDTCIDECPEGIFYYPKQNSCELTCDNGSYTNGKECLPCHHGCESCYGPMSCMKCKEEKFLIKDDFTMFDDCRTRCPRPKMLEMGILCMSCPYGCEKCKLGTRSQFLECESCISNYQTSSIKINNTCELCHMEPIQFALNKRKTMSSPIFTTDDTSYKLRDSINLKYEHLILRFPLSCEKCGEGCQRCENETCVQCEKGYFKNYLGSCSVVCPQGYFKDHDNNTCEKCSKGCKLCESQNKCLVCDNFHIIIDGQCLMPSYATVKRSLHQYYFDFDNDFQTLNFYLIFDTKPWPQWDNFDCAYCRKDDYYGKEVLASSYWHHCVQSCFDQIDCPISCESCDFTMEEKSCISCIKGYEGLISNGTHCVCPEQTPFLDRISKKCVTQCPVETFTLNGTWECVPNCQTLSIYADHPLPFVYRNHCLEKCPEGTQATIDYRIFDAIYCLDLPTREIHESLLERIDSRRTLEEDGFDCYYDETFVIDVEEYLNELAKNNYMDVIQQHQVIDILFEYILCQDERNSTIELNLLSTLHVLSPLCAVVQNFTKFHHIVERIITKFELLNKTELYEKTLRLFIDHSRCLYSAKTSVYNKWEMNEGESTFIKDIVTSQNSSYKIGLSEQLDYKLEGYHTLLAISKWSPWNFDNIFPNNSLVTGPLAIRANEGEEGRSDMFKLKIDLSSNAEEGKELAKQIWCISLDSDLNTYNSSSIYFKKDKSITCKVTLGSVLFVVGPKITNYFEVKFLIIYAIAGFLVILLICICIKMKNKKGKSKEIEFVHFEQERKENEEPGEDEAKLHFDDE